MNKIHKVIFCKATQTFVAVSELAKSQGKHSVSGNRRANPLALTSQLKYLTLMIALSISGQSWAACTTGNAVSCGDGANANASQGVAIGSQAAATGAQSTALGADTTASGASSIAVGGDDTDAAAATMITMDDGSVQTAGEAYNELTGLGLNDEGRWYDTTASGPAAIAVGVKSKSTGAFSVALGTASSAEGNFSIALGVGAHTDKENAIALGAGSTTEDAAELITEAHITSSDGSIITYQGFYAGADSLAAGDQVSVGSEGYERQIKHVSPGKIDTDSTDAVNGSQLYVVTAGLQDQIAASESHYYSVNDGGTEQGNYNNDGATGSNSLAAGVSALASGNYSSALGYNSKSYGANALAMGNNSIAGNENDTEITNTIAIGTSTRTSGLRANAIGYSADANAQDALAIGTNAQANQQNTVAVGISAKATALDSTAVGAAATASKDYATAIGYNSGASATNATAVGRSAKATTDNATAVGYASTADIATGIALGSQSDTYVNSGVVGYDPGTDATSTQTNGTWKATRAAVAVGSGSSITRQITSVAAGTNNTDAVNVAQLKALEDTTYTYFHTGTGATGTGDATTNKGKLTDRAGATGANALTAGVRAKATASNATAIGTNSQANNVYATALGYASKANADYSTAVGYDAETKGQRSNAIGMYTEANGDYSTALGYNNRTYGANAVSVGNNSTAGDANNTSITNTVAIGTSTKATGQTSTAIGYSADATAQDALAAGTNAQATSLNASSYGAGANANSDYATALGYSADALATDATAVGRDSRASAEGATATGRSAQATGKYATATGRAAVASKEDASAFGRSSTADIAGGVALGSESNTYVDSGVVGYDPGTDTTSTQTNGTWKATRAAVAVGSGSGITRQITSVAAGTNDTDAVNVAQLKALEDTTYTYFHTGTGATGTGDATTNKGKLTDRAGATGANALTAGVRAKATASNATAIGTNSQANNVYATALGNASKANADYSTAVGYDAETKGQRSNAIGMYTEANGDYSTALGYNNRTYGNSAISIGHNSIAGDATDTGVTNTVAIGSTTRATGQTATAIGYSADATAQNALAAGVNAQATSLNASSYGASANANSDYATALGYGAYALAVDATAVGRSSRADAEGATAIGRSAQARGKYATATGRAAVASKEDASAFGRSAIADIAGSVALGSESNTYVDSGVVGYDPGTDATSTQTNGTWKATRAAVAVGSGSGITRQITSVAAGTKDTDAVNVAQLKALEDTTYTYFHTGTGATGTGDATTNKGKLTDRAGATGNGALAAGVNATATANYASALGYNADASAQDAIAVGRNTVADSNYAIAIGYSADATDALTTAIGVNAQATANQASAFGRSATASGVNATAIGTYSDATKVGSSALGYASQATGDYATALGYGADATAAYASSLGYDAQAKQTDAIAIGKYSRANTHEGSVALGSESIATVDKGVVGYDPETGTTSTKTNGVWKATRAAVSVGSGTSKTRQITSVAAGTNDTDAVNVAQLKAAQIHYFDVNSTGGGNYNNDGATGTDAIAIGLDATAAGANSFAIGEDSNASRANAIAIGADTDATSTYTTAIGRGTQATKSGATAIGGGTTSGTGVSANASGSGSVAIGGGYTGNAGANASATRAVAIGNSAEAGLADSIALGSKSVADTDAGITGVDPLNTGAVDSSSTWKSTEAAVSIGDASNDITRQITDVAAGTQDTDAVNVAQLKAVANTGFNITADDTSALTAPATNDNVALGETVKYTSSNKTVTTKVSNNEIDFAVNVDDSTIKVNDNGELYADVTDTNTQSTVSEGDGISVTPTDNADGTKDYEVAVNTDGTTIKVDGDKLSAVTDGFTATNGKISADTGTALATSSDIADAINKSGFTLTSSNEGTSTNVTEEINPSDTVTINGNSDAVKVTQTGSTVSIDIDNSGIDLSYSANEGSDETVSLAKGLDFNNGTNTTATVNTNGKVTYNLNDSISLTQVTTGDTVMNNGGITLSNGTNNTVQLTNDGLDNGGNQITNVASGGTTTTNAANIGDLQNAVATSSWNIAGNDKTAVGDGVNPNEQVNFLNGNATTATVAQDGDNYTVQYDVDTDDTTIKVDGDKLSAVTDGFTATNGKISADTGTALATSSDIADAINKSGFTLTSSNEGTSTNVTEEINPSDTVTINGNSDAVKITQTGSTVSIDIDNSGIDLSYSANEGSDETVSLAKGLDFNNGTNTTATVNTNGKVTYNLNDSISLTQVTTGDTVMNNDGITLSNGTNNTVQLTNDGLDNGGNQITNVAAGNVSENSTDAVNGAQLYTETQTYFHTNDADTSNDAGNTTTNLGSITDSAGAIGTNSVTAGINATARGSEAIAIGYNAQAWNIAATTSTGTTEQQQASPIAIGDNSNAGAGGVAIGDSARAGSFGAGALPTYFNATAIGHNAKVYTEGGVAVGYYSSSGREKTSDTTTREGFGGYNPLTGGYGDAGGAIDSTKATSGAFSVGQGDAGNTDTRGPDISRQIINVAAGTLDSDAVNVAQLKAVASAANRENYFHVNDGTGTQDTGNATTNKGKIDETAGATGTYAVAAGVEAQATGQSDVVIGYQAGKDMTSTDNTTAIGNGAGRLSQGGSNTFIGIGAGTYTVGDSNAFLGNSAGLGTNGQNNTALGTQSGNFVVGKSNTSLGESAGNRLQGDYNNSIGAGAGTSLEGDINVSIGLNSGANLKGDQNVSLGYFAGDSLIGSDNISIGTVANRDITADKTVAIGYSSKATVDDAVALGSNSTADRTATTAGATANATQVVGSTVYALSTANDADKTAISNTVKGNLGAVSVGSTSATRQIINVAAGTLDSDAVNVAQLKAVGDMTVKPLTIAGNTNKDTDAETLAGTTYTAGDGTQQQLGETLNIIGATAAVTGVSRNTDTATTGNYSAKNVQTVISDDEVQIQLAENPEFNTVVIGDDTNNTTLSSTADGLDVGGDKITNVADGDISANSSDVVNGSQLYDTNTTIAKGFNIAADNGSDDNVQLGGTVTYTSSDGNIVTTVSDNQIDFGLANTVTIGDTSDATANPVTINGETGTINGLTNTTWIAGQTPVSGQAATEDQLKAVSDVANAGFTVTGKSATTATDAQITPSDTLNIVGEDANTDFSKSDAGSNIYTVVDADDTVRIGLAKDVKDINSITLGNVDDEAQTSTLTANADGNLDVGGDKITNVANGDINANSSDVVNGSQLYAAQAAATTKVESTNEDQVSVNPVSNDDGSTTYQVGVVTTELTTTDGKVNTPSNSDNLATAGEITDAINNSGFKLDIAGNIGDNSTTGDDYELINPGETVTIEGGNNVTVSQTNGTIKIDTNNQDIAESAQLPVVYTKADGTKVYLQTDGSFNTAADGSGDTVASGDVIASMQNADGSTTAPTSLTNVAGNLDGAKTGTTAPTTVGTKPDSLNVNNAATVGDVLNAGWSLGLGADADSAAGVDFVTAYDTVNFVDGNGTTARLVSTDGSVSNITYDVNYDDSVFELNSDGELTLISSTLTVNDTDTVADGATAIESTTTTGGAGGDLTIDAGKNINADLDGTTVTLSTAEEVDFTSVTSDSVSVGDTVNISSDGIDAGSTTITNVAAGTDATDAVNVSQLDGLGESVTNNTTNIATNTTNISNNATDIAGNTANIANNVADIATNLSNITTNAVDIAENADNIALGLNFAADSGDSVNRQLGDTVDITGDDNITTQTTDSGVEITLNDNLTADSLTTGDTVINTDGVSISGGENDTVSLSNSGLDNGGNTITNVADGELSETSTEAVNGSQLYATNQSVATNSTNISSLAEGLNTLSNEVNKLDKETKAGIAGSAAIAILGQPIEAGDSAISAGIASHEGQSAIAVGASTVSDNGKWILKGAASVDTQSQATVAGSATYTW